MFKKHIKNSLFGHGILFFLVLTLTITFCTLLLCTFILGDIPTTTRGHEAKQGNDIGRDCAGPISVKCRNASIPVTLNWGNYPPEGILRSRKLLKRFNTGIES